MSIHENDVGTCFSFVFTNEDGTPGDLSTVSLIRFRFQAKGHDSFDRTGEKNRVDGSDGKIVYYTVDGDLTPANKEWKCQGYVETLDGKWNTDILIFEVVANLPPPPTP